MPKQPVISKSKKPKYRYSPLYAKFMVPKPLQRILKIAALVLSIGVLLAAYFMKEISLNLLLGGIAIAIFIYWVMQPIPKRNQR